jgi:hypothetical protein
LGSALAKEAVFQEIVDHAFDTLSAPGAKPLDPKQTRDGLGHMIFRNTKLVLNQMQDSTAQLSPGNLIYCSLKPSLGSLKFSTGWPFGRRKMVSMISIDPPCRHRSF